MTPPADETGAATRPPRKVRSFVPRAGRMTRGQERAWRELWPAIGIEASDTLLDLDATFGRSARRTVEIGFGNGETLVAQAAARPEEDFLGIEVHRPGVGHLMLRCEELAVSNLRIVCRDAVEVFERQLPPGSIDEVLIYFPDPWPKKRHHKRRLVQDEFVTLVASRLRDDGALRLATDWLPYAEWMLDTLHRCPLLRNESPDGAWSPRPASRPPTRFELRGQRLGHEVRDLAFRRV